MKFERFFTLCCACASFGVAFAQNDALPSQLNGSFDLEWKADSVGNGALPGQYLRPGFQPQGWEASNVNQKVWFEVKKELVFSDTDRAKGEGNGFSAKMVNTEVGAVGITSPAPAYITWGGTPWVYAVSDLKACDGGTVGGREFKYRPDSIVGYYKRTVAEGSTEPAKILLYAWRGEFKSTVKVNPKGSLTSSETAEVIDQDIAVLGKITEGVTASKNAELVASCEYSIEGALNDWTRIAVPLEYKSDKNPEKMAVIISSSNYWSRAEINSGNILWADDVELVYNSKLNSVKINGVPVEGFDKNVFEYEIDEFVPVLYAFDSETDGVGATVEYSVEGNVVTIAVQGADYDVNKENEHQYKFRFTRTYKSDFQLPNWDFEDIWTYNEYKSENGVTYSEESPEYWNSFYHADGDFAGAALMLMANQAGSVKKVKGCDGEGHAALIFSRKNFLQTISNGNLTTGIVHMGAMVASDMNNYNYSDLDNPRGHCEFNGLPDSVSVYMKFEPKDASKGNASMNMILHSEYEYKDPGLIMGTEDSLNFLIANAKAAVPASEEWVRYSVPFEYNGEKFTEEGKRYMLISFSTNEKPGVGSDGDSLSIDKIRFIYNSGLKSLKIDGNEIAGIEPGTADYVLDADVPAIENVEAVANGIGAVVETAIEGNKLTVTVKGNDYEANPENVHVYTVTFDDGTGIESNNAGKAYVTYADGQITVTGADGETVRVYTVQGIKVAEFTADGRGHRIDVDGNSVCIVKTGAKVFKVVVR